jgi:cellulose synthase/poly-beta-1,6-N-acetylglucosamine synthase-like glycosyltransferase
MTERLQPTTVKPMPAALEQGKESTFALREMVRVQKERVFRPIDFVLFFLLSLASFATIANFFVAWFLLGDLAIHPVLFLLLTGLLLLVLINQQGRWYLLLPMRRPRPLRAPPGLRVAVVTTYVPDAEPREMVEHTLEALVAIDYPHDTWLLDEADDPAIRRLCEQLGVRHFSRRGQPEYQTENGRYKRASKHGNYNAWLDAIGFERYDILAAFDPDHVPHASFLHHSLGYFRDDRVGYVQSAQAYYNQGASVVARGAAEETYAYYSAVQMASFGMGYPIIVGSHNVHRMSALREVGGFAAHDADDLLLTIHYRGAGWEGVYVPRILARGLTPVDWRSYLTQQRRWARSVLDIKCRRRESHAKRLPLGSRIMSLLHGINFMHRSIVGTISVVILVLLLAIGQPHNFLRSEMLAPLILMVVALQISELYRQRFYLDWQNERGLHWRSALLEFAKWPWLLMALFDVLRNHAPSYAVTWKKRRNGLFEPFILYHGVLGLVVALAWMIGTLGPGDVHPFLRVCAALVLATSAALVATELVESPPPYDRRLWRPIRDPDARP